MNLLLCATDGSPSAGKALTLASKIAKVTGAKLLIVHVKRRHGSEMVPDELQFFARIHNADISEAAALEAEAQRITGEAEAAARKAGLTDVEKLIAEGDPTQQISQIAAARQADAVVVGSRGRSEANGLLLGSVSHKVAQLVPCTCIIAR
jgi:nucleotide-binding universal stress UspA family protein